MVCKTGNGWYEFMIMSFGLIGTPNASMLSMSKTFLIVFEFNLVLFLVIILFPVEKIRSILAEVAGIAKYNLAILNKIGYFN